MKKLFRVILIIFVAILSISSISLISDVFRSDPDVGRKEPIIIVPGGSSDVNPDDTEEEKDPGVIISGTPTVVYNTEFIYTKINKDTNESFSYDDFHLVAGNENETVSINDSAYCSVNLLGSNVMSDGVMLADYKYITIEFDVGTEYNNVLNSRIYLLYRDANNGRADTAVSYIEFSEDETTSDSYDFFLTPNGIEPIKDASFKVKYVIAVNEEAPHLSRLQVYVNDVLCSDSMGAEDIFTKKVVKICEIRICLFEDTLTGVNGIEFKNLVVTGYN